MTCLEKKPSSFKPVKMSVLVLDVHWEVWIKHTEDRGGTEYLAGLKAWMDGFLEVNKWK